MWKVQQPSGLREINELHVPVGRNVRLIMASEDVIHDFFVPGIPREDGCGPRPLTTPCGSAHQAGRYHFFCSQYCGTNHALNGRLGDGHGAIGLRRVAFRLKWSGRSVVAGEKLFVERACSTCHFPDGTGRAPSLNGLYGSKVSLADGSTVGADDGYIRESSCSRTPRLSPGTSR